MLMHVELTLICFPYTATLQNLCEEDKQCVRQLITELAQAAKTKDVAEKELCKERCQYRDALIQLNQQLMSLERERLYILLYTHTQYLSSYICVTVFYNRCILHARLHYVYMYIRN